MGQVTQELRARLLDKLSEGGKVEKAIDLLWQWAESDNGPVALAALREILNRSVGSPEKQLTVAVTTQQASTTVERAMFILDQAGVPLDRWPMVIQEHRRSRMIESKVVE